MALGRWRIRAARGWAARFPVLFIYDRRAATGTRRPNICYVVLLEGRAQEVIDSSGEVWVAAQGSNNTLDIKVRKKTPKEEWTGSYEGG